MKCGVKAFYLPQIIIDCTKNFVGLRFFYMNFLKIFHKFLMYLFNLIILLTYKMYNY